VALRVGLFTDSVESLSLDELLTWLEQELPEVNDLEIGTGGYSPVPHCDPAQLLAEEDARKRWLGALTDRGFRLAALNVSGNPLEIADHDHHLRQTIELASALGVGRIVCMSGGRGDLAGGNWFPGIDDDRERYWQATVLPYWDEISRLASTDGLRLCFELEPGAAVYNVTTFERLAESRPNLAVNLDPSHFFWQSIDPLAVARRLEGRIAFAHGKDTELDGSRIALDGVVDRRSWRFATVGEAHDLAWWRAFCGALQASGYDDVVSVEYEDPTKPPLQGVLESARALSHALGR
jgi:sugar phosphate isomerase/epimerase